MTKIDLYEATREQLVEAAGLRPLVADAALMARDEPAAGSPTSARSRTRWAG